MFFQQLLLFGLDGRLGVEDDFFAVFARNFGIVLPIVVDQWVVDWRTSYLNMIKEKKGKGGGVEFRWSFV